MDDPSISMAFRAYRNDYILMKNQSPKTVESYDNCCKLLVRKFGDIPISSIKFEDVRMWHEWLSGWQSKDTIRNNIINLRMVLKFMAYKGYDVLNYQEIPVQKREKRKIKYLTQEEMNEFLSEVGKKHRGYAAINRTRNHAIVTLLYATGIRNSELCALNRDDIKNRSFTVVGKSREERICFIDTRTEQALKEYLALRKDKNPAMFVSPRTGTRIKSSQLRDMFQVICERSEKFKKIHPHTLRHSFATKMLSHEVDLRYIGDLMGHVDLNTTKMYTHYENPKLKEIYDKAHA